MILLILGFLGVAVTAQLVAEDPVQVPLAYIEVKSDVVFVQGLLELGNEKLKIARQQLEIVAEKHPERVDIIIDSQGGKATANTIEFMSYIGRLKEQGTVVRCIVPSLAASLALVILSNCSERYATPNASVLFHSFHDTLRASTSVKVTIQDYEKAATRLRDLNKLWEPFQDQIDDSEFWNAVFLNPEDTFFKAEDLARAYPNTMQIVLDIRVVQ